MYVTTAMCDSCKGILPNDEKHTEDVCPIAMALTCSCCKTRGHSTLNCTKMEYWNKRVPEYMEQLIPYEMRCHYLIPPKQCTPLAEINTMPFPCVIPIIVKEKSDLYIREKKYDPVIEIPQDRDSTDYKAGIRATLASHNLPTGSVKDNKRVLEAYTSKLGKKVIYMKKPAPKQDVCEAHAGKAKKQAICLKSI